MPYTLLVIPLWVVSYPGLKGLIVEILAGFCSGVVRLRLRLRLRLRCGAMIVVVREESDDLFDGCNIAVSMYMEEDRVIGCVVLDVIVVVKVVASKWSSHVDVLSSRSQRKTSDIAGMY
jgi:hypothetical protein